jgi:type I restriction enzyme M protein
MLTDPKLRSQVDALWDKFWTGGLSNPLDAIEQFSYLLFLKRLDDRENAAERQAKCKGLRYQPSVKKEMRWGYWSQMKAEEALSHLKNVVFPGLVELADVKSSFGEYMKGAQCKINKAGLLIEACNLIDQMKIAEQNQDVQGDLYEYMLGHMQFAGRGGQFRTPRLSA